MNLRILTLAACSIAFSAFAEVISPEEALARINFTAHHTLSITAGDTPQLVKTEVANDQPTVYIYTTGNDGYMILSADDKAEAMLAYGSNFNGEINPAMQWLLGEYSKEIESMRSNPKPMSLPLSATVTEREEIAPLLTTKWNQSEPYNNMCPKVNGERCATGCVATAMAQVINYHKIPSGNGNGIASYEWNGQTLSFDFANNSFDWDNMLDVHDENATEEQKAAVAELMYACGISVQMEYGVNASGAFSYYVPNALIEYFGFDKGIHQEQRIHYTIKQWNDYIYSQLRENGPLYLSGSNDSSGHAFVCDGYSSDDFFHINWGWGGSSDGYFKLSALDPDNQGIGGSMGGYSAGLDAISVKIPSSGSSYFKEITIHDQLSLSVTSASLGDYASIYGGFYNTGTIGISGNLGFIIENTTTGITLISPTRDFSDLPINYGWEKYSLIIPSSLAEGSYKVYPAWKTSDMDWEKMRGNTNYTNYIEMTVIGSTAHFTVPDGTRLEMLDEQLTSPIFIGYEATMTGTLNNISSSEYYGAVFAALLSSDGSTPIAYGNNFNVEIEAGASKQIHYSSLFYEFEGQILTAGNYLLVFADQTGLIISSAIPVEVQEAPAEAGTLSVPLIEFIGDRNNADRNNLGFNVTINCTNGYFIGNVNLWIFAVEENGYNSVGYIPSPMLYINEGESTIQSFKGSMPSLSIGHDYVAVAYQEHTTQLSNLYRFTIGEISAVENTIIDNDVIPHEYYTISGVKVAKENLTPGLYIVVTQMSDGQVVTTKKIVN